MKPSIISKLALSSIRLKYVTSTIFALILIFGFLSYTRFLPRQGFPALEFPIVFIQTPYEVNDLERVDAEITTPIENALEDLELVNSIATTTSPNFSVVIVNFETEASSTDKAEEIENIFEEGILPEGTQYNIAPILTGSFDGENDAFFGLVSDSKSIVELEDEVEKLAVELEKLDEVDAANVIYQNNEVLNPETGESTEQRTTFNRYAENEDGENLEFGSVVGLGIVYNSEFTVEEVSKAVNENADEFLQSTSADVEFVSIFDQAEDLDDSITSLESNALAALVGVIIVLLLFVNWRASLIAAIFIPTVMAATFGVMLLAGVSLNTISLFALILVLGLLVDDAIVVVEAIDLAKRDGKKGKDAIIAAINSVGRPDVVGTITTLVVFLPMLGIIGVLGDIIRDIPIVVSITLVLSLAIALTIIPFFSNLILPDRNENEEPNQFEKILNLPVSLILKLGDLTANFVNWYLSKWYYALLIIIAGFGMIFTGFGFGGQIPISNFPQEKDSLGVQATFNYNEGLTTEERENLAIEFENLLVEDYSNEIEKVTYPFVGRDSISGRQQAIVFVELTGINSRSITSVEIAEDLDLKTANFENVDVSVISQSNGGPSEEYASRIQIFAEDTETLERLGTEIKDFIATIELPRGEIEDSRIDNLDILSKRNGSRYAEVATKLNEDGDDLSIGFIETEIRNEFSEARLAELGLPEDALQTDRGFAEEFEQSAISAGVALGGSFVIMFFFLMFIFRSPGKSLLILLALPFSFFGLFGGLLLTDNPFSFFVTIGIIALTGIVVNNAIILQDFANQGRKEGKTIRQSMTDAVRIRFRPLVTTSVTTLVGLLPLALSEPFWEPLAYSIAFGLASSAFMVIFIFPAFYAVVEKIETAIGRKFKKMIKRS